MSRLADRESDLALIEAARNVIRRNYDADRQNHTVGAALRCANGSVYLGVNVHSLHGVCAELVAIGAAMTAGEREFVSLACVRGAEGDALLPPCGNCRQMLSDYAPECEVLIAGESGPVAFLAGELLPFAYRMK